MPFSPAFSLTGGFARTADPRLRRLSVSDRAEFTQLHAVQECQRPLAPLGQRGPGLVRRAAASSLGTRYPMHHHARNRPARPSSTVSVLPESRPPPSPQPLVSAPGHPLQYGQAHTADDRFRVGGGCASRSPWRDKPPTRGLACPRQGVCGQVGDSLPGDVCRRARDRSPHAHAIRGALGHAWPT